MKTTFHSLQNNHLNFSRLGVVAKGGFTFLRSRVCLLATVVSGLVCAPAHAGTPPTKITPFVSITSSGDPSYVTFTCGVDTVGGSGAFDFYLPYPDTSTYANPYWRPLRLTLGGNKRTSYTTNVVPRNSPDMVNRKVCYMDVVTKSKWHWSQTVSCQIVTKWGGFFGKWYSPQVGDVTIERYSGTEVFGTFKIGAYPGSFYAQNYASGGGQTMSGSFSIPNYSDYSVGGSMQKGSFTAKLDNANQWTATWTSATTKSTWVPKGYRYPGKYTPIWVLSETLWTVTGYK